MPKVSVVVPAYNAENTIEKIVKDILNQSYDDFELILVDDGSDDKTAELCDFFASKDPRVIVLHQQNGGLSNARNNGTKKASGEYVTYIDSDDRVESYYLEFLIRAIEEAGVDIACGRIDRVKEDYEVTQNEANYSIKTFHGIKCLQEMLTGKNLTVGACCRMVPRGWQLDNPFIEGTYYEDLSNTYKINLKAKSIALVDAVLYHYTMRGGSITGKKTTTFKQCMDYDNAIELCSSGVMLVYPELKNDVAVLMARDYMSLYLSIKRCADHNEELLNVEKRIREWMHENWRLAASNSLAPLNVRLRTILFRVSPELYRKVYYVGIKVKGKKIS